MDLLIILAIYIVTVVGMSLLFSIPWLWIAIPLGILLIWIYLDDKAEKETKNNQGNASTKTKLAKKAEPTKPVYTTKEPGKSTSATNSATLNEKIKSDTKFLLDTGIKIVSKNSDGGFIKFYFEAKDSELQIHLCDTHLLRDFEVFESKSKFMSGYFQITEQEAEKFLTMTRIYIQEKYSYDDWMSFDYYYPGTVSKSALKKWVEDYLKTYYSKYELKYSGNTLSLMIYN